MFRKPLEERLIDRLRRLIDRFIKVLDEDDSISAIRSDIREAENNILIFSPFVDIRLERTKKILNELKGAIDRGVKVKVVIKHGLHPSSLKALRNAGVEVYTRDIHAKAVIIDDYKVIYIGSSNILASYGKEDVMLRITGLMGEMIPKILSKKLFEKIKSPKEEEKIT